MIDGTTPRNSYIAVCYGKEKDLGLNKSLSVYFGKKFMRGFGKLAVAKLVRYSRDLLLVLGRAVVEASLLLKETQAPLLFSG